MKAKYQNLLKPTQAQIKFRAKLWVDALRDNKRKTTGTMYCKGGRCCLAVAQDVAISCGVPVNKEGDDSFPDDTVRRFFGWTSKTPDLVVLKGDGGEVDIECSVDLNDGVSDSVNRKFRTQGLSHKQIAECVENTFIHPSKKKFSFKI